jgi:hypothetical protein
MGYIWAMLLTLMLSPIISGPIWPALLLVLIVCVLLPMVGLGLLLRGTWLLREGVSASAWLMMGLACLLLSWGLFVYFDY